MLIVIQLGGVLMLLCYIYASFANEYNSTPKI